MWVGNYRRDRFHQRELVMASVAQDVQELGIDEMLVRGLVASQCPQWAELLVRPVVRGGWDNRTFHIGEHMLARFPSARGYAAQVDKEQYWLPKLAPFLPLPIPVPLAIGEPADGYPWRWSVYHWIEGETADVGHISNERDFAVALAQFLVALQGIDPIGGPVPGPHNLHRGGALAIYDVQMRRALAALVGEIDIALATEIWETALASTWLSRSVWIHGDVSPGNLLLQDGQLKAIIDFGNLGIGDPACDLAIAWTLFKAESREAFRATLPLDTGTWARGRAWTLWKALIVAAGFSSTNAAEAKNPWRIIDEVLEDHSRHS